MSDEASSYAFLMANIGNALAAWSGVENSMGLMFTAGCDIADFDKAGAIFDAVVSFEVRLALLDAMVEHDRSLSGEEKELWKCLSIRLRKLYRKRHPLAHFAVIPAGELKEADRITPFFSWNKHNRAETKTLGISDIKLRSDRFNAAANAVGWFVNLFQRRKFPSQFQPQQIEEPELIVHMRELESRRIATP